MSKRVAIYTRVSTTDGQTVDNQLRDLRIAGERLGWTIVSTFTDEGISGATAKKLKVGVATVHRIKTAMAHAARPSGSPAEDHQEIIGGEVAQRSEGAQLASGEAQGDDPTMVVVSAKRTTLEAEHDAPPFLSFRLRHFSP
jgi:hypothetical protein